MDKIKRFFKDEEGASAVEYALLVSLIAVVIITAVTHLGENAAKKLQEAADGIVGKQQIASNPLVQASDRKRSDALFCPSFHCLYFSPYWKIAKMFEKAIPFWNVRCSSFKTIPYGKCNL